MFDRLCRLMSVAFTRLSVALNLNTKFIFIVEDNILYAQSLRAYLTLHFPRMKVKTFSVGEACLKELHRNPIVVIMDNILNSTTADAATGLSIIEQIRKTNADTRIILLSVETNLDVFVKSLSLYGCTYLRKDDKAFVKVEQYIRMIY